jgi:hypothetical protein
LGELRAAKQTQPRPSLLIVSAELGFGSSHLGNFVDFSFSILGGWIDMINNVMAKKIKMIQR